MGKATSGEGCESGAKKTCDYEGATAYFYNEGDEKLKCEDLIKKLEAYDDDEEEAESSESKQEAASSESKAEEPASSESKSDEKPTSSDDKKEEPAAKVLASCLISMVGTITGTEISMNAKLCVDMTDAEDAATLQEKCVPATASKVEDQMPGIEISIENPASCPTEGVTKSCLDRSTGMTVHSYVESDRNIDCSEFLKSDNIEGILGA